MLVSTNQSLQDHGQELRSNAQVHSHQTSSKLVICLKILCNLEFSCRTDLKIIPIPSNLFSEIYLSHKLKKNDCVIDFVTILLALQYHISIRCFKVQPIKLFNRDDNLSILVVCNVLRCLILAITRMAINSVKLTIKKMIKLS